MRARARRLGLWLILGPIVWAIGAPPPATALPIAYTDFAAFQAAVPGVPQLVDFDALAAGTAIGSGGSVGPLTFSYDFGGVSLEVSTGFDTTSGANYLGTDDGGILQDGDDFDIGFVAANAVGAFFLSADTLENGDIALSASGGSALLAVADVEQVLPDGTSVYFLGLIDDGASFDTASVTTIGGGFFLYNVDDLVVSVPEPRGLLLVVFSFIAWLRRSRWGGFA